MTDIRDEVAAALEPLWAHRLRIDDVLELLAARGLTVVREGELEARDEVIATILAWPALPEYPRLRDAIGAYRARFAGQRMDFR